MAAELRTPLDAELMAALRAPAPRTPAQMRRIIGHGGRFYRNFGLIIWGVVVLIPGVVGATSPGREIATFLDGFLMTTLMFGLPCQIFIEINRRKLTKLARTGVLGEAVVMRAERIGRPSHPIVDATLEMLRADGGKAHLHVTGLPGLPPVGAIYTVLADPAQPLGAGVVAPPVGIIIARVRLPA